jgi:hypothetical protein
MVISMHVFSLHVMEFGWRSADVHKKWLITNRPKLKTKHHKMTHHETTQSTNIPSSKRAINKTTHVT